MRRTKEPWEVSDGAVHLVREIAATSPDVAAPLLPRLADLARLRHFEHSAKLRETIWNCLPLLADRLGKTRFKRGLEGLLEPLFRDLSCGNALCECAAGKCISALRAWLGPSVLAARLDGWQIRELESNANVLAGALFDRGGDSGAGGGAAVAAAARDDDAPREPRQTLAERMKGLPAGAPIPHLLAP